jgi:hypothetical protein
MHPAGIHKNSRPYTRKPREGEEKVYENIEDAEMYSLAMPEWKTSQQSLPECHTRQMHSSFDSQPSAILNKDQLLELSTSNRSSSPCSCESLCKQCHQRQGQQRLIDGSFYPAHPQMHRQNSDIRQHSEQTQCHCSDHRVSDNKAAHFKQTTNVLESCDNTNTHGSSETITSQMTQGNENEGNIE